MIVRKRAGDNRLGIHVREIVCTQVMDEGLLKGLHELRERPALRLN